MAKDKNFDKKKEALKKAAENFNKKTQAQKKASRNWFGKKKDK